MIKRIPTPIAGLMLALAALGNLIASYGSAYRYVLGGLSLILMLLLCIKGISMPEKLAGEFKNPLLASVMPTFSMGLMILATYIKPYSATMAYGFWFSGLGLHIILILLFTKRHMLNLKIKSVYPSYFIVYVGIVVASVTAPAFDMVKWGQAIFYFGFLSYLLLLPIVLYRVFIIKGLVEASIPSLTIFAAPASLCLAGYLNSFQDKNMYILGVLILLSLVMFIGVILQMPKMLGIKFYPSYSAFTFPFVITGVAMKGLYGFLAAGGRQISYLLYLVKFLEFWSLAIVIYVFVGYIKDIISDKLSYSSSSPIN